jgi:alkanesulfonate monooxygenase SsuD/methylene tetrahydromethanopterin reductase-like flavin-dependent oxidoreductase (luciferase family)
VDYKGEFYELHDARLGPKPFQRPSPPIWFGGFSDTILSMIVEYGNGWINATNVSPDFVDDRLNKLKTMAKDSGRDPAEIEAVVPLVAHVAENKETAKSWVEEYIRRGELKGMLARHFADGLRRYGLWGTPKDCISKIQKYTKIGIKYFILDIRPPDISLDSLSLLSEEVIPHFIKK